MSKKVSMSAAVLTAWMVLLALMLAYATPALATHRADHEQGSQSQQGQDARSDAGDNRSESGTTHANGGEGSTSGGGAGATGDADDNEHPSGNDRETNDGPEDDGQGNSPSDPDDDGHGPDRSNGGPDKPGGTGGVDQDDQDGNNGCGNDDDFEDDNEGLCRGRQGPKNERGQAQIAIVVDCFSVSVTSTREIAFVEVNFVDGTTLKFPVHGTEFSQTFTKQVESATARSGKIVVSAEAPDNCVDVGSLPEDDQGLIVNPGGPDDDQGGVIVNPGGPDEDEVAPGVIERPGLPSEEDVLGVRINRAAPQVAAVQETVAAAPEQGAVLPFTGASLAALLSTALGLIASGLLIARTTRKS